MIEPIKEPPIKRIVVSKIIAKQDKCYKFYNKTQDLFIKENKQCQMNKII